MDKLTHIYHWGNTPLQDDLHAKHYADVRIEIDDQVKELTLNEFRELIFGKQPNSGRE